MTATARLLDLGKRSYRETLELQRTLHAQVSAAAGPPVWLVVEHPPVVTLGRNAKREHLLFSEDALRARDVDCVTVERGGDVTYHGPGQVVVYPIVRLERFREVVPFVSLLELAVVEALQSFGITGKQRPEHRGVYVGSNAICAVGLTVRAMTTMHGLALNVSTALDYDRLIVPCGTPQFGITSIARETGRSVSWAAGRDALLAALQHRFNLSFIADLAA